MSFPRWSVLQIDSLLNVAQWTHDEKALRTNQHYKEWLQQSGLTHVTQDSPWSCLSLATTQSSFWHHNRILPPLHHSLCPSFTLLPAFFSLGPFFAPPRQKNPAHMSVLFHQMEWSWEDGGEQPTEMDPEGVDWCQAKWTVPPGPGLLIPILGFHSAKQPNKPLVPLNKGNPPALQARAAISHCKAAGSSQWTAR